MITRRPEPELGQDIQHPVSYRQDLAAKAVLGLVQSGFIPEEARDRWYEEASNCRMSAIQLAAATALLKRHCGWSAQDCSAAQRTLVESAMPVLRPQVAEEAA